MNGTFLDKILERKRERVQRDEAHNNGIAALGKARRAIADAHRLETILRRPDRINIIAEIKRASPSKGVINADVDAAAAARAYEAGGAAAISVLTEEDFFAGSLADLETVRNVTSLPILRKDFIIDDFQIYEAAAAGADAVLLICAALDDESLGVFHRLAVEELGMDAIVEVHTQSELERALRIGARVVGINNRNLKTLEVSLDVSRALIKLIPRDVTAIAESGIRNAAEIRELKVLGFDGFLIGEELMRQSDPASALMELNAAAATGN